METHLSTEIMTVQDKVRVQAWGHSCGLVQGQEIKGEPGDSLTSPSAPFSSLPPQSGARVKVWRSWLSSLPTSYCKVSTSESLLHVQCDTISLSGCFLRGALWVQQTPRVEIITWWRQGGSTGRARCFSRKGWGPGVPFCILLFGMRTPLSRSMTPTQRKGFYNWWKCASEDWYFKKKIKFSAVHSKYKSMGEKHFKL